MSESKMPKFIWFIAGAALCASIFMSFDASWIMPALFFGLFLGPLVIRGLFPTRLRSATDLAIAFGLFFANPILVGLLAALCMVPDKAIGHLIAMLIFWTGFIGIQGVIYGLAMRGPKREKGSPEPPV